MRVAVISDVHGNRLALESVLEDIAAAGADVTVNLGDVAAGPLDPVGTLDRLIPMGLPTVRGNHDRWVVEGVDNRVDTFVAAAIGETRLKWLADLPATQTLGSDVFLCHGTPTSDTDPWLDNWFTGRTTTLPDEVSVTRHAVGLDYPVLLCGHTHVPRVVHLRDGRMIVNPGSVGLPFLYGSPAARYALVTRKNGVWTVDLKAIAYDSDGAAQQAEANGFPYWREAITTGWGGPEGLFD